MQNLFCILCAIAGWIHIALDGDDDDEETSNDLLLLVNRSRRSIYRFTVNLLHNFILIFYFHPVRVHVENV